MPELHKLTTPLGVLQDRGHRVALVTDGRMSGASGKIPAAIHVTPEAAADASPIARLRDGDLVRLDADAGTIEVLVDHAEFAGRPAAAPPDREFAGTGRELFESFRRAVGPADAGASIFGRRRMSSCLDIAPVVPVVVLEDATKAVPLARALAAGGLPIIELTLRTPRRWSGPADRGRGARGARRRGHDPVHAAGPPGRRAGAQFLVSPGSTPALLAAMDDTGLPYLPGTSTVSEMLAVAEQGHTAMKFFPAEAAGGAPYLASLASPLPHLRFCPTGGITAASAGATCGCRTSAAWAARGSPRPTRSPRVTGPGSPRWRRRSRSSPPDPAPSAKIAVSGT